MILHTIQQLWRHDFGHISNSHKAPIPCPYGRAMGVIWRKVTISYWEQTVIFSKLICSEVFNSFMWSVHNNILYIIVIPSVAKWCAYLWIFKLLHIIFNTVVACHMNTCKNIIPFWWGKILNHMLNITVSQKIIMMTVSPRLPTGSQDSRPLSVW